MKLKEYLQTINKSQTEAAKELNVTRQYLGLICNGKPAGRKLGLRIEGWSDGKVTIREVCSP